MNPTFAMIVPLGGQPDQGLPGAPDYPDQGLPGQPPRPDQGLPGGGGDRPSQPLPGYPDNGLPGGGIVGHPSHPIVLPPVGPSHPIHLPPSIWPGVPIHPDNELPGQSGEIDNSLPQPPGHIWPPLPPSIHGKVLILVWVVCVGWRWIIVDTTLSAGNLPAAGAEPRDD
jgi:hypothetical protein